MSIAMVLGLIDGTESSEAALQAALQLGKRFSARVDLLHVEIDVASAVPVVGEGMSGAAVEQIMQSLQTEAQARATEARRVFEAGSAKAKLTVVEPDAAPRPGAFEVSFRHVVGREADEIIHRGRLCDLIVVARATDPGDGEASAAFDVAMFDTGRPTVLVPAKPVAAIGETVAVAWNQTREAARAVGAAIPILAKAKKVVILTGRESDSAPEPSELARYLAAHGVSAKTWAFTPKSGAIGDELLAEAQKADADLLVMGAYGHSRLRELVLGGATRGVLGRGAIPILLAH